MNRLLVLIPVLLVFLFSSSTFALPNNELEELKKKIQKILKENQVPGASISLVNRDGLIWAGGIGIADLSTDTVATGDTLFRVGSTSKSFTALSVLSLVEEGRIDLDTPIRELIPEFEFSNPWSVTTPISTAMLLEHTTGFDDMRLREFFKVDDPSLTLEMGLAFGLNSRVSRWKPGTHYSYANSGPAVAAYIVEKLTGKTFEEYTRESVLKPLEMNKSMFTMPQDPNSLSKGYESDLSERKYVHITLRPSGALNSTAIEMANYLDMMINRGNFKGRQIFSPQTIERMERPTTTLAAKAGFDQFGYGLGNETTIEDGHVWHGHDGLIHGFITICRYSPTLGLGYFISLNKPNSAVEKVSELIAHTLTRGKIKTKPEVSALSPNDISQITGYYKQASSRNELSSFVDPFTNVMMVSAESKRIVIEGLINGEKIELLPVTNRSFRLEKEPIATHFLVEEEGYTYIQSNKNLIKSSFLSTWAPITLAIFSLVILISFVLFALLWVPGKLLGKFKSISLRAIYPQLAASLSFFGLFIIPAIITSSPKDFISVTPATLTIFTLSLSFAFFTSFSVYRQIIDIKEVGKLKVKPYDFMVTLSCSIIFIYFLRCGLIGMRLWAY